MKRTWKRGLRASHRLTVGDLLVLQLSITRCTSSSFGTVSSIVRRNCRNPASDNFAGGDVERGGNHGLHAIRRLDLALLVHAQHTNAAHSGEFRYSPTMSRTFSEQIRDQRSGETVIYFRNYRGQIRNNCLPLLVHCPISVKSNWEFQEYHCSVHCPLKYHVPPLTVI